jgi:cytochrome c oxidase assembly protein subunit 15
MLVIEIVFGGLTVNRKLDPRVVMSHFLLAMVLLWVAVVLEHRAGQGAGPAAPVAPRAARLLGRVLCALAGAAFVTGTLVTGSGPHGGDERVERLPFFIPAVARVHGLTVVAFLALTVLTLALLRRTGAPADVHRRGAILVAAIVGQAGIGYLQYFTGVPPGLVLLHVLGATVVWISVLRFHLGLWARPVHGRPPPAAVDDRDRAAARVVAN